MGKPVNNNITLVNEKAHSTSQVIEVRKSSSISSIYVSQIHLFMSDVLKYYSPTVAEGKTFALVFCNSE